MRAEEILETQTIADLDRRIVLATQSGLPVTTDPFATLAEELGVPEALVLERLREMQESGMIRRIAAVPNHFALGYAFNGMTVWDVDDDVVDEIGRKVGALEFVSHCYRRPRRLPDWRFNLFAMVHSRSRQQARDKIAEIRELIGPSCRAHDAIFSRRILKKTGLRLTNR